jgi:nucleoid DNA-binding protein
MSMSTPDVGQTPEGENILEFSSLVETLAQQQSLPDQKVRMILRGLFALAAEGLKEGKAVRIRGLGVLRVREAAAARVSSGQPQPREQRKRIVLSPDRGLKSAVGLSP